MSLRFIIALWDKNIHLNMVNFEMLLVSLIACSKAIFFLYHGPHSLLLKGFVVILHSLRNILKNILIQFVQ